MNAPDLAPLLERLGLPASSEDLVRRALTHPSWAEENGGEDYERLEFLGDSVLALVVAEHLHRTFPLAAEGDLTRMRTSLVSGRTLAERAREIGLSEYVLLGNGASGESGRQSVLEACFEALAGAIYLTGGLDAAAGFALTAFGPLIDDRALLETTADAKTELQEVTQGRGLGLPAYRIVRETGPAHQRDFSAEVLVGGEVVGSGAGTSKQSAERAAAAAALITLQRARGRARAK